MTKFFAYIRTIKQYLQTPKGNHDFWDYLKATCIILATMFIIYFLLKYFAGELQ